MSEAHTHKTPDVTLFNSLSEQTAELYQLASLEFRFEVVEYFTFVVKLLCK